MGVINCSDICNLIQNLIKKCLFQKTTRSTHVYKNGHNSAYDQYFFLETCTIVLPEFFMNTEILAWIDSSKISIFIKNSGRSLFSEQVTYMEMVAYLISAQSLRRTPNSLPVLFATTRTHSYSVYGQGVSRLSN